MESRKCIRMKCYDYNLQGAYFITVCTHERKPLFGWCESISEYEVPCVRLSPLGEAVNDHIAKISAAYPMIAVEKYVIMPNHIHLLLFVNEDYRNSSNRRDKMLIAKAMQSFKASVSRQAKDQQQPIWQSRYYDHVIRSDDEFLRIWQYIDSNPAKWKLDCYYTL